jgi:kynureninase
LPGVSSPRRQAGTPRSREEAAELDRTDPLARYREAFVIASNGPIYLDGNSLGRQPRAARQAVGALLEEWAGDLVGGWERWAELPWAVGDRVGQLVGAAPGQVIVSDSTTVNLHKLAVAALDARPGRGAIIGDANDFPTVRYVLEGVAEREGRALRLIDSDPIEGVSAEVLASALNSDVALVCLSAVNYRSGAVVDMADVNRAARTAGAVTLWDLCHAAGVVPVELDAGEADLAVGCSYKYLNGGPGAPAWLYVRSGLQESLRQPIWGWWGQQDQFAMGPAYEPLAGVGRFLAGTPAVLGLVAIDAGIAPLLDAGIPAVWAKARSLVALLAQRADELLVPRGARLASPADEARRGGHLAVAHPRAWAANRLLIDRGLVVPDFRPPNVLRLAPVAVYTGYAEVWDAVERIAEVLDDPAVELEVPRARVT